MLLENLHASSGEFAYLKEINNEVIISVKNTQEYPKFSGFGRFWPGITHNNLIPCRNKCFILFSNGTKDPLKMYTVYTDVRRDLLGYSE